MQHQHFVTPNILIMHELYHPTIGGIYLSSSKCYQMDFTKVSVTVSFLFTIHSFIYRLDTNVRPLIIVQKCLYILALN